MNINRVCVRRTKSGSNFSNMSIEVESPVDPFEPTEEIIDSLDRFVREQLDERINLPLIPGGVRATLDAEIVRLGLERDSWRSQYDALKAKLRELGVDDPPF